MSANFDSTLSQSETKIKIMQAALDCFSTEGFHAASIKAIAKLGKIKSPALIYHYFSSKTELFTECVGYFVSNSGPFPEIVSSECFESHLSYFNYIAEQYVLRLKDTNIQKLHFCALSALKTNPEIMRTLLNAMRSETFTSIDKYLKKQISLGKFRNIDSFLVYRQFMAPLYVQIMINSQICDFDDIVKDVIEIIPLSSEMVVSWLTCKN